MVRIIIIIKPNTLKREHIHPIYRDIHKEIQREKVETETGRKIGIYPETKHPSFFLIDGKFADGVTSINVIDKIVEN